MRALVAKERRPKRRADREAPSIAMVLLRSALVTLLVFTHDRNQFLPAPPAASTFAPLARRAQRISSAAPCDVRRQQQGQKGNEWGCGGAQRLGHLGEGGGVVGGLV